MARTRSMLTRSTPIPTMVIQGSRYEARGSRKKRCRPRAALGDQQLHLTDRSFQPYQNRTGDDAVADVVLDDLRNLSQARDVALVESMPGVGPHSELEGELGRLGDGLQ